MKDFLLAMVAVILAATPKSAIMGIDTVFQLQTKATEEIKTLKSNLPNFTSPLSVRRMLAPWKKIPGKLILLAENTFKQRCHNIRF